VILLVTPFQVNTAGAKPEKALNLTDFSLEELLAIEVISVSGRIELAQAAAAAIHVITAEEIRRCGAVSIPEVLRLAPGLTVARMDANKWAVSTRGFNSRFANHLQVLVDGRSVYSPMFSGAYWEAAEVPLESIERIEVIRGPGATIWGSNAVNGVINIITRDPRESEATRRVSVRAGNEEPFRLFADTGALPLGEAHLNLNVDLARHDRAVLANGAEAYDGWDSGLLTGRLYWDPSESSRFSLSGHFFHGDLEAEYPMTLHTPPYQSTLASEVDFDVASLTVKWSRLFADDSRFDFDVAYSYRDRLDDLFQERMDVFDVEAQYQFAFGERQSFVWGWAWRYYESQIEGLQPFFQFTQGGDEVEYTSCFLQDEITLVPERLRLVMGTKYEAHQNLADQWQPNLRLAWTPSRSWTLWGAASRALHTPAHFDRFVRMDLAAMPPGSTPWNPDFPVMLSLVGNEELDSEKLTAWEMGCRAELTERLHGDLALFVHRYSDMRESLAGAIRPHSRLGMPVMQIPMYVRNGLAGDNVGGDLALTWQLRNDTRLHAAWSHAEYDEKLYVSEGSALQYMASPADQFSLRAQVSPSEGWEIDAWFRHVGELQDAREETPAWSELDLRLSWRPSMNWRLTVAGQNLLNSAHHQFAGISSTPRITSIERGFYTEIEWAF